MSQADALANKLAWLQVACTIECDEAADNDGGGVASCPSGEPCNVLHYVPGENDQTWEAWWDDGPWPKARTAACGAYFLATLPGMFSRMGAPRCDACCAVLAITPGKGAAMNDDTCRPAYVPLSMWLQLKAAEAYGEARALYDGTGPDSESHRDAFVKVRQEHAARLHRDAQEAIDAP